MKYDTIIKCDFESFKNEKIEYTNIYLLSHNECSEELEIDLTSDMWFNTEYKAINRQEIKKVNNIQEVMNFLKEHNIQISDYAKENIFDNEKQLLYVGGCNDLVLDFDLNIIGLIEYEETQEYIKNRKKTQTNV